jgi:hypothetical protein
LLEEKLCLSFLQDNPCDKAVFRVKWRQGSILQMIKICPKCRQPQDDERLVICPSCKVAFEAQAAQEEGAGTSAEDIARSLSAGQLARIAEIISQSWKFRLVFVGVLVIGILLSVPTAIVFTMRHATGEIERGVDGVKTNAAQHFAFATNESARQFQKFVDNATNQISAAYRVITQHISEQFQEPRIRKTVEDVAGKEAKAILEAEVRPTVESFRADAEFLRLATRARAYDFKAYQRLLDVKKGTNEFAQFAEQVLAETDRSLDRDRTEFMPHRVFMICSGTNTYTGPFTSDELAIRFAFIGEDKTPYNREGFVNTVAAFNQPLFLGSLVTLFTNETDLGVADRLTVAISKLAKEDMHPRDFERLEVWWHAHESEYTNWPLADFDLALSQLLSGNSNAVTLFERVLKTDPKADMSRALLVSCLSDWGDTNRAATVAKQFDAPSGRWAKWAAARMQLAAGGVSNATVQFATLAKENPSMLFLPKEGVAGWSAIDWPLFRKIMSK